MEYEDSDLKKVMRQGVMTGISQEHIKLILYNLLCAVKYVHSANVMHRDFKPANILIDKDCQVKLCDFGISRTLPDSLNGKGSGNSKRIRDSIMKHNLKSEQSERAIRKMVTKKLTTLKEGMKDRPRCMSSHVSSRWYRAPELSLIEKQYDQASDMWSLGCCIFELLHCAIESKEVAAKTEGDQYRHILF